QRSIFGLCRARGNLRRRGARRLDPADGETVGPLALDGAARTAPQHAAAVPSSLGAATQGGSAPDAALGLSTEPRAAPGGTPGVPAQAGQARHQLAAARCRRGQTAAAAEPAASDGRA